MVQGYKVSYAALKTVRKMIVFVPELSVLRSVILFFSCAVKGIQAVLLNAGRKCVLCFKLC